MSDDIARLERQLEQERQARQEAEALLEEKSDALYNANLALKALADDLENQVYQRTKELQVALGRAEESARAKSDFLAMMSHEIRTPMNGVLGMAQMLEMTPLSPEQFDYVTSIRTSGDALLVVINDILDYANIEAGKLDLVERDFSLAKSLQATVGMHRLKAVEKGLKISLALSPDLPTRVRGDRNRLQQILSNLLSNAIKFTERGDVKVRAKVFREDAEGILLGVEVRDTGVGISPQRRERMFQPFSQGDEYSTRRYGGTGLGLAICSKLCAAMHGRIEVESSVGEGSAFRFAVRLKPAEIGTETAAGELTSMPDISGSKLPSVLVVDDDEVNRALVLTMLEKIGVLADAVSCGQDAVSRVSAGDIDVILMDMQMPGMDGVQATQFIRGLDLVTQPHIIALTANVYESDRRRCMEAGMDDFMPKPVRLNALRARLASLELA